MSRHKCVEENKQLLKEGVIWRVGNGANIRSWRDPWLPREANRHPRSLQGRCRYRWVADFLLPNGAWNMQRLNQYFQQDDIEEICRIKPSTRNEADIVAWLPEKRGTFLKVPTAWPSKRRCKSRIGVLRVRGQLERDRVGR
jgi:hypothetical protein